MAKKRYKLSDAERKEYISLRRRVNYRREKIIASIEKFKPKAAKKLALEYAPPRVAKHLNEFRTRAEYEAYKASLQPYAVRSWKAIKAEKAIDYQRYMIAAAASAFGDQLQIDVLMQAIGQMSEEQVIEFSNTYNSGKIGTWYNSKDKKKAFQKFLGDINAYLRREKK